MNYETQMKSRGHGGWWNHGILSNSWDPYILGQYLFSSFSMFFLGDFKYHLFKFISLLNLTSEFTSYD